MSCHLVSERTRTSNAQRDLKVRLAEIVESCCRLQRMGCLCDSYGLSPLTRAYFTGNRKRRWAFVREDDCKRKSRMKAIIRTDEMNMQRRAKNMLNKVLRILLWRNCSVRRIVDCLNVVCVYIEYFPTFVCRIIIAICLTATFSMTA